MRLRTSGDGQAPWLPRILAERTKAAGPADRPTPQFLALTRHGPRATGPIWFSRTIRETEDGENPSQTRCCDRGCRRLSTGFRAWEGCRHWHGPKDRPVSQKTPRNGRHPGLATRAGVTEQAECVRVSARHPWPVLQKRGTGFVFRVSFLAVPTSTNRLRADKEYAAW